MSVQEFLELPRYTYAISDMACVSLRKEYEITSGVRISPKDFDAAMYALGWKRNWGVVHSAGKYVTFRYVRAGTKNTI